MNKIMITAALIYFGMAGALTGCAQVIGIEDLPDPCSNGDFTLDAQVRGAMVISFICQSCHSRALTGGQRGGAPNGINFDNGMDIDAHGGRIHVRAIDQRTMPPSSVRVLTEDEVSDLRAYLACR